jgi:hypothetical protein
MVLSELTKAVVRQKNNEIPMHEVLQACLLFVFYSMRRCFNGDEELWHDYLSDCSPRILRAVEGFTFDGRDFIPYLRRCVQFHMRDYVRNHRIQEARRSRFTSYSQIISHSDNFCSDEIECNSSINLNTEQTDSKKYKEFCELPPDLRRLTLVFLRLSNWLNDGVIHKFAEETGLSEVWLHEKVEEVRQTLEADRARFEQLTNRSNELHFYHFEQQWKAQDNLRLGRLGGDYFPSQGLSGDALAKRRQRINKRLAGIRLIPTNSCIAKILNIPKGSVDSGIYYLRKKPQTVLPILKRLFSEDSWQTITATLLLTRGTREFLGKIDKKVNFHPD